MSSSKNLDNQTRCLRHLGRQGEIKVAILNVEDDVAKEVAREIRLRFTSQYLWRTSFAKDQFWREFAEFLADGMSVALVERIRVP
jgi:hypothetical protein